VCVCAIAIVLNVMVASQCYVIQLSETRNGINSGSTSAISMIQNDVC